MKRSEKTRLARADRKLFLKHNFVHPEKFFLFSMYSEFNVGGGGKVK